MIRFILNNKPLSTNLSSGTVLLDLIRYHEHLMGTKIGCREGDCGACTVLIGELVNGELKYESMTSCLVPLGNIEGKHVVTIEGINFPDRLNPVQQALAEAGATQCGFCTPGFVMSLAGFCLNDKGPSEQNAIAAIDGNICRCTGYKSIERAATKIASALYERNNENPIAFVVKKNMLPEYFSTIKSQLLSMGNGQLQSSGNIPQTTDHGPRTFLGGGTDLYVQKHEEMVQADIEFVFDNPKLNSIRKEGNKCILGSSVTVTDLKNSEIILQAFPKFHQYAKLVSSTPIRNMATIGGNFINASPIGDFTIFFLALNAELLLNDGKNKRPLPLRKLYKSYKTLDKKPEEYIEEISFELPRMNGFFHFEKVSKRTHLDIATVNTAIMLSMNDDIVHHAGISAGGVGPVPMYLEKTSEFLKAKSITEELVKDAIEIAFTEISPISDARGTKEYKRLLLGQLVKAHFISLFPELREAVLK